MKVGTKGKIIIGILVILVVGFIGFRVLKVGSPEIEVVYKAVELEEQQITTSDDIALGLYRNGDIEFLSETVAMADYDYGLKLVSPAHEVSYPSGRMFFIIIFGSKTPR